MVGRIKTLKAGFGFLTPEDGSKDIFFHAKSLMNGLMFNELHEGDSLSFEVESTPKGMSAINVQRAEESMDEAA